MRTPLVRQIARRSDVWVGLFFALLGVATISQSTQFPADAARMPMIVAISLTALGAIMVIRSCFVEPEGGIDRGLLRAIASGPLLVTILLLCWAYLLARGFGFIEMSVPMVMAIVYLMGHRRLATNALCSCAIVLFVFLLFYGVLGVLLPLGVLSGLVFG